MSSSSSCGAVGCGTVAGCEDANIVLVVGVSCEDATSCGWVEGAVARYLEGVADTNPVSCVLSPKTCREDEVSHDVKHMA